MTIQLTSDLNGPGIPPPHFRAAPHLLDLARIERERV